MPTNGSSPLTRGARLPIVLLGLLARLIPAYAGNTLLPQAPAPRSWAHPRLRAEHSCLNQ